jgi:ATP-dependent Clp protease ATP-binding subunit ClpC
MPVLKGHFRPEFLNRIDEIIVFNALSRQNIRAIVQIQLDRVRRTAAAQDITLKMGEALVEHLVEEGYQPEFGARELKRQVRQMIETQLAKEILSDTLKSGDTVEVDFDRDSGTVTFNKLASPATEGKSPLSQEKNTAEKKSGKGTKGTKGTATSEA